MGAVKVTKLEAAQRQVNAAIRMLFDGYDAVAVHTVTAAAHQIVRDICRHRKDVESYLRFTVFSSRRRHTRLQGDWSSDVCSSDLNRVLPARLSSVESVLHHPVSSA